MNAPRSVAASGKSPMAEISKSMQQWLTPNQPQLAPHQRKGEGQQMLPISVLRSKLESSSQLAVRPMPPSPSYTLEAGASSVQGQTIVGEEADISPGALGLKSPSLDDIADYDEVGSPTPDRPASPQDPEAPHPTPLHLIEALAAGGHGRGRDIKRGPKTWIMSDFGGPLAEDDATTKNDSSEKSLAGYPADALTKWFSIVPKPPKIDSLEFKKLNEVPDDREIDVVTGRLLPAVSYPRTHLVPPEGPCRNEKDVSWRQANMSSELHIMREIKARERLAKEAMEREAWKACMIDVPPREEAALPKARCLLRPATPADFAGIANIMNLESQQEERPQVFLSEPVKQADVANIFVYCQENSRPFIVATPTEDTDILDRSKWPRDADDEYKEFVKFKKSQQPKAQGPPPVVGFAFVVESRLGIFGSHCAGSRFAAEIKLIVHPEYRRKSYGSALLDRVLLSVAAYHQSAIDYKWDCEDPGRIYNDLVVKNRRKYARIFLETAVTGQSDSDQGDFNPIWLKNMLEGVGFEKAARFNSVLRTDRKNKSQWLDLVVWQLEARPPNEITDDNPRPVYD